MWSKFANAYKSNRRDIRYASNVVKFLCAQYLFKEYVFEFSQATGPSMIPTLRSNGNILFVNKLATEFSIGDVVVAVSPKDPDMYVTKRITAEAGETVTLDSTFMNEQGQVTNTAHVPANHFWLEGDNKMNSTDSRHYGPVSRHLIVGKVTHVMWPPADMGKIKDNQQQSKAVEGLNFSG
mmetsp:Transcript_31083/g.35410  ORF Transcript_31083/g.35410 Transcript_31083/m.35410 type:complete len:180 (-) Transcript_31083:215-754(-)